MKSTISIGLFLGVLVSGCVMQPVECASTVAHFGSVLEDKESSCLLKVEGKNLIYWYKGVDTSEYPECIWTLEHQCCSARGCLYRNTTTGAEYMVNVSHGGLEVCKKSDGRNLGVEPMRFLPLPAK